MRAAEEADAELASVLGRATVLSAVQKLQLLKGLEFDAEHDAFEHDVAATIANAEKVAAGERGDRVKFAAAVRQQATWWRLFLATMLIPDDAEPTVEMIR